MSILPVSIIIKVIQVLLVEVGEAEVDAGFVEVDRTEVNYLIE